MDVDDYVIFIQNQIAQHIGIFDRIDAVDELSARPDFATLIYPVVSLEPPYDRTTTRRSPTTIRTSPTCTTATATDQRKDR